MLVRYRVMVKAASEASAKRFLDWMKREHGPEMLQIPGCREYRVFLLDKDHFDCSYLFESRAALEQYLTNDAERMRAKGKKIFPNDELSFQREVSDLLLMSC